MGLQNESNSLQENMQILGDSEEDLAEFTRLDELAGDLSRRKIALSTVFIDEAKSRRDRLLDDRKRREKAVDDDRKKRKRAAAEEERMVEEAEKSKARAAAIMKGGSVEGYPTTKFLIVRLAAYLLYKLAFIPTQDPTNGLRCFSNRVIKQIPIESGIGGTYSIELLVKCHRLGLEIAEIPSRWIERKEGKSKFQVWKWIPYYLKWFLYGFSTTYLGKKEVETKIKLDKTKLL